MMIAVGLAACDEDVNPFLESDQNYTLFGTLDMGRDTQYVRVIPIRGTLGAGEISPLDVTFISEDLEAGERQKWRDSVVTFANGTQGHVFYAPLRLRPGHTYRVEITPGNSDVITTAQTTVPAVPDGDVRLEELVFRDAFALTAANQAVVWTGIDREPWRIDHYYRFMASPNGSFQDVHIPKIPDNGPTAPAAWEVEIDLLEDKSILDTLYSPGEVPLAGIGMELTMLDLAFSPPEGRFDPEVLVQPGTMSNVENGFGFVGSVARFSVEWLPDRHTARLLGYMTLEDLYRLTGRKPEVRILPFEWSALPDK
ncbi:MAG TPA: hypothetical protein VMO47_09535 [Rhodothermales bacterium]|nr:hypothetical protein [Rhodothermales bacterium]